MIFVTIGSMFPFDRLIKLVDDVAAALPSEKFFAQIGDGAYEPAHMPFARMLSRREFGERVAKAKLIVAHAGMGSVISAMERNKPIVLLPRLKEHGEVTTDHQVATSRWLAAKPGIHVTMDEAALRCAIESALAVDSSALSMSATAPGEFLARIRNFIAGS